MHLINRTFAQGLVPISLVAAVFAAACSSDTTSGGGVDGGPDANAQGRKEQAGTGGAGGTTSASGGFAGKASGGTTTASGGTTGAAGASTGGKGAGGKASTDAGSPDATVTDGGRSVTHVDAGPGPEAVLCADADATATSPLLVGGTTYCKTCATSEVAAIDVAHGCVLGRATFTDYDTIPRVSGGQGFVLQRTNGVLSVLSKTAEVTSNIDLNEDPSVDGGATRLDPQDVVYVSPNGGFPKAFVSLYYADAIAVVNMQSRHVQSRVDLSQFHDASDSDGSSDPDVGFYDATTNRVYFVLQRTDLNSATAPDFAIHCPPVPSVLVAIDPTTDQLVDLNGAATGVALPLSFVAPADVAIDATGRRALVLSNGCADTTGKRIKAGIEAVDLDTLALTTLYTSTSGFLNDLTLLTPNSGVVTSFDDNFATHYNLWGTASQQLGAELTGVPDMPIAEDATSLLGVAFEAEPRVKRFHVTTKDTTTVVSSPWSGKWTTAAGNALFQ
jgi:hypothetical protein